MKQSSTIFSFVLLLCLLAGSAAKAQVPVGTHPGKASGTSQANGFVAPAPTGDADADARAYAKAKEDYYRLHPSGGSSQPVPLMPPAVKADGAASDNQNVGGNTEDQTKLNPAGVSEKDRAAALASKEDWYKTHPMPAPAKDQALMPAEVKPTVVDVTPAAIVEVEPYQAKVATVPSVPTVQPDAYVYSPRLKDDQIPAAYKQAADWNQPRTRERIENELIQGKGLPFSPEERQSLEQAAQPSVRSIHVMSQETFNQLPAEKKAYVTSHPDEYRIESSSNHPNN
jgi:hypothetical protein